MRRGVAWFVGGLMFLIAACGEPAVDLAVPERAEGQRLFDEVGALDEGTVSGALDDAAAVSGLDVVGLVFEDDDVSAGQADRGGRELLDAWGGDVVLVAVAAPGDFTSDDEDRERFFGVYGSDRFEIPRSLREDIIDNYMTPLAAENAWTEGFQAAAEALADQVEGADTS